MYYPATGGQIEPSSQYRLDHSNWQLSWYNAGVPSDPLVNPAEAGGDFTITNGYKTLSFDGTGTGAGKAFVYGTHHFAGKWYIEFKLVTDGASMEFGVCSINETDYGIPLSDETGNVAAAITTTGTNGGDVFGVAFDLDTQDIYFRVNSAWYGGKDPDQGDPGVFSGLTGTNFAPAVGMNSTPGAMQVDVLGESEAINPLPQGYLYWKSHLTDNRTATPEFTVYNQATFAGFLHKNHILYFLDGAYVPDTDHTWDDISPFLAAGGPQRDLTGKGVDLSKPSYQAQIKASDETYINIDLMMRYLVLGQDAIIGQTATVKPVFCADVLPGSPSYNVVFLAAIGSDFAVNFV